ncbi:shikimate kinase [Aquihabitans daechungensis]|uniref:shikimate kinase n=1 Tax=Aquihabitans daechungensis TaxID=1052257 RepID=UPI003B9F6089
MDSVHHIAIVGLMGAGKTTVGRLVADDLGWPLVDSDEVVLERTGMTVAELWERGGEPAFRPHEREAVTQALAGPGPDVVAVAAGAIEDSVVVTSLRQPGVLRVWLRVEPGTVAARVTSSDHRPLIDADPLALLTAQAAERAEAYEDVADLVLDVEQATPHDLAAAVTATLRARPTAQADPPG